MGPWQLDLLLRLGLDQDATLLDLGCGTLRGGLHFIRFLRPGRYHGAEVDEDMLARGARLVSLAGLDEKAPRLMSLVALDAQALSLDWVLTQSVLNHLDEHGTVATVGRVSRSLGPEGRWVSTACFDAKVERVEAGAVHGRRPREFWRSLTNPRWFRGVLDRCGLYMEEVGDAAHPRGLDVFVARRVAPAQREDQ